MDDRTVLRRGLSLVADHVRLHPGPFAIAVTGALVFAASTVLATVVLGRVTDEIVLPAFETGTPPASTLWWASAAVVAVTVLRVSGVVVRRYFAGMTSERVQVTLRHRLVEQYLGLPLAWHQRTPAGQLLAHADNDSEIATEVLHPLPFSLGVAFLAVFSAISLVLVDPLLALVAFLIFPALTGLNKIYSNRVEKPAAEVQAAVGTVSSIAHESFDGALVVKTLGRADAESARFDAAAQDLRAHRVEVGYIRALFEAVMDALPNVGIVFVVILGVFRIEAGAVTPGQLVQVAALFTVLSFPMRVFGFFLEMVPPSVVARDRLIGVFDEPLPSTPLGSGPLPDGPVDVDVQHVKFGYETSGSVLADVSFQIGRGEVLAIVGSTGAGKSTLAHLLTGLVPPEHGAILIGGVALDALEPRIRTTAIALVFQESFLFADTLRHNIDLSGERSLEDIRAAAAIAQVDDFAAELVDGYETVIGERGVTLSGGQRQRVALARALLQRPRLLVLDDATSAVDPRVEQEILRGLKTNLDMTTVIVAQRVSTIELADRVIYVAGGRIAGDGTHDELMHHPGYEALARAYEEAAK